MLAKSRTIKVIINFSIYFFYIFFKKKQKIFEQHNITHNVCIYELRCQNNALCKDLIYG